MVMLWVGPRVIATAKCLACGWEDGRFEGSVIGNRVCFGTFIPRQGEKRPLRRGGPLKCSRCGGSVVPDEAQMVQKREHCRLVEQEQV
jgi:hypothetical protein